MPGFDDFIDNSEETEAHDLASATRSRADDILDAVDGVVHEEEVLVCPKCKGKDFQRRGPSLGGTTTLRCRGCRFEIPWATTQNAAVPLQSEIIHAGPFYSGAPKPKPDMNQPPNRITSERSKK